LLIALTATMSQEEFLKINPNIDNIISASNQPKEKISSKAK